MSMHPLFQQITNGFLGIPEKLKTAASVSGNEATPDYAGNHRSADYCAKPVTTEYFLGVPREFMRAPKGPRHPLTEEERDSKRDFAINHEHHYITSTI